MKEIFIIFWYMFSRYNFCSSKVVYYIKELFVRYIANLFFYLFV